MSYMPNRRCRHAQLAGRKSRLIQQVCHHARRLEEWHRYWRGKKWRRWSVALCRFQTLWPKNKFLSYTENLYLLDHHIRKAYCVIQDGTGDGRVDDITYPYSRTTCKPPVKTSLRLLTFDELLDMEEDKHGLLGHIFSIDDLEIHRLHEVDADTVNDRWHDHLVDLFRFGMRDCLPKHFPKDYRFPWRCSNCDTMQTDEIHRLDNSDDDKLCEDCYYGGRCDRCEHWSDPRDMRDYSANKKAYHLCEDCYDDFLNKELVEPLEDYLKAEHCGWLKEPLDRDPYWIALMQKLQDYIIMDYDLDSGTYVWLENPRELVDEALTLSSDYSSVAATRIPWYARKGWRAQQVRKQVPKKEEVATWPTATSDSVRRWWT